jgi:hypothetical protein
MKSTPMTPELGKWALEKVGLSRLVEYTYQDTLSDWNFDNIHGQLSTWTQKEVLFMFHE